MLPEYEREQSQLNKKEVLYFSLENPKPSLRFLRFLEKQIKLPSMPYISFMVLRAFHTSVIQIIFQHRFEEEKYIIGMHR